ncbi:MAG: cell division protein FtsA [Armatimonadota bacterium]
MAYSEIVTGLDVGTTKICALVAEIGEGREPEVLGIGTSPCTGLRKGVVVDIEATTAAIRDAVRKAETMADEQIHGLVVGVTGEHVACVNSRSVIAINNPGQEITGHDVSRLLDSARVIVLPPEREIIHAIPRWFSIDGQKGMQSPVGMHGNRIEVETHIVTGLSSFIQNVVKCVHQAGFSVEATVLEPIASGEAVLLPDERDLGVALVDIGGGTSDIAIYMDGEIYYSGAIPIGGNHVTKDIAVGLRTSVEEAERVKLACGCALSEMADAETIEFTSLGGTRPRQLPRKVLAEIIEPRVAEICQFVLDHLERAGAAERLPAGLVFTGGGSGIPGLPELATEITGLAARIGVPTGFSGLTDTVANPACSTAAGLVLYWHRNHREYRGHGEPWLTAIVKKIRELIARFGTDD